MNQFVLVGRIAGIEKEDNKYLLNIRITRNFKNEKGKYDTDLLKVHVFNGISDVLKSNCEKENVIGVKGRIQEDNILIAEKITVMSNK